MGRIYDKFLESSGTYPPGSWRWEIEFKREEAEAWHRRILEKHFGPADVAATVAARFARFGVTPNFRSPTTAQLPTIPRAETDAERKLAWLKQQVRPTIRFLSQHYTRDELLIALGLDLSD